MCAAKTDVATTNNTAPDTVDASKLIKALRAMQGKTSFSIPGALKSAPINESGKTVPSEVEFETATVKGQKGLVALAIESVTADARSATVNAQLWEAVARLQARAMQESADVALAGIDSVQAEIRKGLESAGIKWLSTSTPAQYLSAARSAVKAGLPLVGVYTWPSQDGRLIRSEGILPVRQARELIGLQNNGDALAKRLSNMPTKGEVKRIGKGSETVSADAASKAVMQTVAALAAGLADEDKLPAPGKAKAATYAKTIATKPAENVAGTPAANDAPEPEANSAVPGLSNREMAKLSSSPMQPILSRIARAYLAADDAHKVELVSMLRSMFEAAQDDNEQAESSAA